jgi:hypothetical protein
MDNPNSHILNKFFIHHIGDKKNTMYCEVKTQRYTKTYNTTSGSIKSKYITIEEYASALLQHICIKNNIKYR